MSAICLLLAAMAHGQDYAALAQTALSNNDALAAQQLLRMSSEPADEDWIRAALHSLVAPTPQHYLPNARSPRLTRDGLYVVVIRDGSVFRIAIESGAETSVYEGQDAIDIALLTDSSVVTLVPSGLHRWRTNGLRSHVAFRKTNDLSALSKDGSTAATVSGNRLQIWDVEGQRATTERIHLEGLTGLDFGPEHNLFATAQDQRWQYDNGVFTPATETAEPIVPTHRWRAVQETAGVSLYDSKVASGSPRWRLHEVPITSLRCRQDGAAFFSTARDGSVVLTRLADLVHPQSLQGHQPGPMQSEMSPDGSLILTFGDHTARLWTTDRGQPFRVFHHEGPVLAAAIGPEAKRIVTADLAGLHLWSMDEPQLLATSDPVTDLAISPDGSTLWYATDAGESRLSLPSLGSTSSDWRPSPNDATLPDFPGLSQVTASAACADGLHFGFGTESGDVHLRTRDPDVLRVLIDRSEPCMDPGRRLLYLGEALGEASSRWQACRDKTQPVLP